MAMAARARSMGFPLLQKALSSAERSNAHRSLLCPTLSKPEVNARLINEYIIRFSPWIWLPIYCSVLCVGWFSVLFKYQFIVRCFSHFCLWGLLNEYKFVEFVFFRMPFLFVGENACLLFRKTPFLLVENVNKRGSQMESSGKLVIRIKQMGILFNEVMSGLNECGNPQFKFLVIFQDYLKETPSNTSQSDYQS